MMSVDTGYFLCIFSFISALSLVPCVIRRDAVQLTQETEHHCFKGIALVDVL